VRFRCAINQWFVTAIAYRLILRDFMETCVATGEKQKCRALFFNQVGLVRKEM
jgi:hypothetical protein